MRADRRGQLCARCYDERAKHVYWDKGEACRANGPNHAECLLEAGHDGPHEGNGYDESGPLPKIWRTPMKRIASHKRTEKAHG